MIQHAWLVSAIVILFSVLWNSVVQPCERPFRLRLKFNDCYLLILLGPAKNLVGTSGLAKGSIHLSQVCNLGDIMSQDCFEGVDPHLLSESRGISMDLSYILL